VAATCRYFGISCNIVYRWKRRWEDEGVGGVKDRLSVPLHCRTITHPEVVEKIIHLWQHYRFGPLKIEMYLRRYHDVEIAVSTIYRILKCLGMNRLPASQRYKRHQKRWNSGRVTSSRSMSSSSSRSPPTPTSAVEKIQTDNGAEFQSAFHWHVPGPGHQPRLHPPGHTAVERQGGTLSPHRRRRVPPTPRRRRPRRPRRLQRQTQGMEGLLQLPPTAIIHKRTRPRRHLLDDWAATGPTPPKPNAARRSRDGSTPTHTTPGTPR
jgi:transposase